MTVTALPPFSSFRYAREGSITSDGRLPQGWTNENADDVSVEAVDLGSNGPSITITIAVSETNRAPFVSLVISDYLRIPPDEVLAMRLDAEAIRHAGAEGAFLILREWIEGGTYVGQATRPIPLDGGVVPVSAARMAGGTQRLIQPVLSIRRRDNSEGSVTMRLSRIAVGLLHEHPAWLTDLR